MSSYSSEFYSDMEISSLTSAKEIVPILLERYHPSSVVDVGCGTGPFALEFVLGEVEDVVGYEGQWMKHVDTVLDKDKYIYCDISQEFESTHEFDMCLCLEVAEHLDHSKARTLILNLTRLSTRIVFSAAIPQQGGNHHVNEQWPDYWARLFAEQGFFLEWDPRLSIWNNSRIAPCYRQNTLVFHKDPHGQLSIPYALVHPEAWSQAMRYRTLPLWRSTLNLLPRPLLRFGKRVLRQVSRKAT